MNFRTLTALTLAFGPLLSGCESVRSARDDLVRLTTSQPTATTTRKPPAASAARTAAKPPVEASAAATVEPERPAPVLAGYTEAELRSLLGPPATAEDHPPGKQWRYRLGACTVDVQLYPDVGTRQFATLAYKVKSDDDSDEGRRRCLAELRSRLPAGR
jgi:hypothetical protein